MHFGALYVLEIAEPRVVPRRSSGIAEIRFQKLPELLCELEQFETWSRLVLEWLEKEGEKVVRAQ